MAQTGLFIGLMSGTSLDGIDTALVHIENGRTELVHALECPWPADLAQALLALRRHRSLSLIELGELDQRCGEQFAHACLTLLEQSGTSAAQITAIGSHGQTLFHHPLGQYPFTLQIGDPNLIAEITGITTIADFRRRDMAAGGQGAPLVPAFHKTVFQHPKRHRVVLNIGGIANISILPAGSAPVYGFDTGPGNCLMDQWIRHSKGAAFDEQGRFARSGQVDQRLLQQLLNDDYFRLPPPKSTGTEYFSLAWLQKVLRDYPELCAADIQATLLELTAYSIHQEVQSHAPRSDEVIICGGGAKNPALVQALQRHFAQTPVFSSERLGINPDWMEAIAFAWLAHANIQRIPGNLPTVTGADGPRILGGIYPGNPELYGKR